MKTKVICLYLTESYLRESRWCLATCRITESVQLVQSLQGLAVVLVLVFLAHVGLEDCSSKQDKIRASMEPSICLWWWYCTPPPVMLLGLLISKIKVSQGTKVCAPLGAETA